MVRMDAELFLAAERGDTQAILARIDNGVDVDTSNKYGQTALTLAVAGRHAETVEALLGRGADPNAAAYYGPTAMTEAALLARGWQVIGGRCRPTMEPDDRLLQTLKMAGGRLGLREAILLGDIELAREICEGDDLLDINGEARFGMHETYLMLASHVGPPAMVDLLLDRGADIEGTDDIGHTALMRAAESGQTRIVGRLLDRGAAVNWNWPCDTALRMAQAHGHQEIVSLLLSRGGKMGDSRSARVEPERIPSGASDEV